MSFLEDVLEVYAEVKHVGIEADALNVGDQEVFDIPDADKINALLVKGKSGKRFRIDGLRATREK